MSEIARTEFNRRGFFTAAAAALLRPKHAIGLKRDLPKFKTGDVLTADQMNEMADRINER